MAIDQKVAEGMDALLSSPPAGGGVAASRGRGGGSVIMHNVYIDDAGKLAAWAIASHLEKPPRPKPKAPPPPPTP
jgi:hypothetical protein